MLCELKIMLKIHDLFLKQIQILANAMFEEFIPE